MSVYKEFLIEGRPWSSEFISGASSTKPWKWAQEETAEFFLKGSLEHYRDFLIRILQENHWEPPSLNQPIYLDGLSDRVVLCILNLHFANKRLLIDVTRN